MDQKHQRPPAPDPYTPPTAEQAVQLANTAAAANIINWRTANVGRVKWGPNESLAFLSVLRTLNEIRPDKVHDLEGEMHSVDPEQQQEMSENLRRSVDSFKEAAE